jgi:hypothetical protein
MMMAPSSPQARLLVTVIAAALVAGALGATLRPLIDALLAHNRVVGRVEADEDQLAEYRANPVRRFDLGEYPAIGEDVDEQSALLRASLEQSVNTGDLTGVRIVGLPDLDPDGADHGFTWMRVEALGDVLALQGFLGRLRAARPEYIVRALDVERSDGPSGSPVLTLSIEVGQLWLAQHREGGANAADAEPPSLEPLPTTAELPRLGWTTRSPFVADHARFVRQLPPAPPPPPAPPVTVRLLGVSRHGGQTSASLLINEREASVVVGDITEAGEVAEIQSDHIVFAGDPPREVSLFD